MAQPFQISYEGRPETCAYWGSDLPHWDVLNRPIFLTLHVAGVIPPQAAAQIHAEALKLHSTEETDRTNRMRLIFRNMETWLDRETPSPVLTHPQMAALLCDALETRAAHGDWNLLHWVIMPSHIHILYVAGNVGMRRLMRDFKRWTGHGAVKILGRSSGCFWQSEWFDHWSRSADETKRITSYIRNNPVRAGLVRTADEWPYGSWSKWPGSARTGQDPASARRGHSVNTDSSPTCKPLPNPCG